MGIPEELFKIGIAIINRRRGWRFSVDARVGQ